MNTSKRKEKTNTPRERERRVWMTLPGDFKKRGAALLHQQCWCFGFDIRRQVEGTRANLLLEMGFERIEVPSGKVGATSYQLSLPNNQVVTLWGFGMCFGDNDGGIFVSRFAFWPRVGGTAAPSLAYSPTHLSDFRAARRLDECERALDYFGLAMQWLADYERRALDLAGKEHRAQALTAWRHAVTQSEATPTQWELLAQESHQVARFWHRANNTTREIARTQ